MTTGNARGSVGKGILLGAVALLLLSSGFSQDQINWAKDYDEALKQASKEHKFFVLDISASW
jgi:hypothetical protein